MDGGNTEQDINETIDWLVVNDFLSVCWDEDGNDYYYPTEAGFNIFNILRVFLENGDDGYQVC